MSITLEIKIPKFSKPQVIEGLGFDCDGTLREKPKQWAQCAREVLASSYGVVVSRRKFDAYQGVGRVYSRIIEDYKLEEVTHSDLERDIENYYDRVTNCQVKATPKARERLIEAAGAVPIAVISSGQRDDVLRALDKLGILRYVDLVVAKEDVNNGKPNKEPIELATRKLGVDPVRFVYIGDALPDVQAAHAGNALAVFMHRGEKYRVKYVQPDMAIRDLREAPIQRLNRLVARRLEGKPLPINHLQLTA